MFPAALWDTGTSNRKTSLRRGCKWNNIEDCPNAEAIAAKRHADRDAVYGKKVLNRIDSVTHGQILHFNCSATKSLAGLSNCDSCSQQNDDTSHPSTSSKKLPADDHSESADNTIALNDTTIVQSRSSPSLNSPRLLVKVLLQYEGIKRGLDVSHHHMGVETNMGRCLRPEEAAYLMQCGDLRCLSPEGKIISTQQLLTMASVYRQHRIYVILCGYSLKPVYHQPHVGVTSYERRINLNNQLKEKNKKKKLPLSNQAIEFSSPSANSSFKASHEKFSQQIQETNIDVHKDSNAKGDAMDAELMAFYSTLASDLDNAVADEPNVDQPLEVDDHDEDDLELSDGASDDKLLDDYDESKKSILKDLTSLDPWTGQCIIRKDLNFIPESIMVLQHDYFVDKNRINYFNSHISKYFVPPPTTNQPKDDVFSDDGGGILDSDIESSSSSDSESVSSLSDSEDVSSAGWYVDWNSSTYMKRVMMPMDSNCDRNTKRNRSDSSSDEEREQKIPKKDVDMRTGMGNVSNLSMESVADTSSVCKSSSSISSSGSSDNNSSDGTSSESECDTVQGVDTPTAAQTTSGCAGYNTNTAKVGWENPAGDFLNKLKDEIKQEVLASTSKNESSDYTTDGSNHKSLNRTQDNKERRLSNGSENHSENSVTSNKENDDIAAKNSIVGDCASNFLNTLKEELQQQGAIPNCDSMKPVVENGKMLSRGNNKNCRANGKRPSPKLCNNILPSRSVNLERSYKLNSPKKELKVTVFNSNVRSNNNVCNKNFPFNHNERQSSFVDSSDIRNDLPLDRRKHHNNFNSNGNKGNWENDQQNSQRQPGPHQNWRSQRTNEAFLHQRAHNSRGGYGSDQTWTYQGAHTQNYMQERNCGDNQQFVHNNPGFTRDANENFNDRSNNNSLTVHRDEIFKQYYPQVGNNFRAFPSNNRPQRQHFKGNAKQQARYITKRYYNKFKSQASALNERIIHNVSNWRQYKAAVKAEEQRRHKQQMKNVSNNVLNTGTVKPRLLQHIKDGVVSYDTAVSRKFLSGGGHGDKPTMSLTPDSESHIKSRGDRLTFTEWVQSSLPAATQEHFTPTSLPPLLYDVYTPHQGYSRNKPCIPVCRVFIPPKQFNACDILALRRHHADSAGLAVATNAESSGRIKVQSFPHVPEVELSSSSSYFRKNNKQGQQQQQHPLKPHTLTWRKSLFQGRG